MAGTKAQEDRIARSLKRLGFQLQKAGRAFKVTNNAGGLAISSEPTMTLAEIERWIGDHVRPKR